MAQQTVDTYATGGEQTIDGRGRVIVFNNGTADIWWTRTPGVDPVTVGVPIPAGTGHEFEHLSHNVYVAAETTDGQDVRVEAV